MEEDMPRRLEIQIQKTRTLAAVSRIEALLHVIHAVAGGELSKVDVNPSEDYCNLSIDVSYPKKMWQDLSEAIASDPKLGSWLMRRWIVVLQGKSGWKDYLLLAHFDTTARLDAIA
jgi:hypothetical protein